MPLISWRSPFRKGKPESRENSSLVEGEGPPGEHMDFSLVAQKVEELCYGLERARDMCEQANLQFDKYRMEIAGLKQRLEIERDACMKAHKQVFRENNENAQLRGQCRNLQIALKRETVLNSQLQARLATETASLRAVTKHARTQEEKLIDTQLDLEYLRCTKGDESTPTTTVINNDAPLPAQPFVVVLIDGDAYQVSSSNKFGSRILTTDTVGSRHRTERHLPRHRPWEQ